MTQSDGTSALQEEGIIPLPLGTLDELRAQGIDPRETACCAPTQRGVIRGCAMADKCRFNVARRGGFKFQPGDKGGMKYVGYRLVTTDGKAKEDFMSCYAYTASMQDREDHANLLRQKGFKGELIGIIAQEGEKIIRRVRVPKNEADKSLTADYKWVTQEVEVPKWPRPGAVDETQIDRNYNQIIAKRERERLKMEDDASAEVFEAVRAKIAASTEADDDWGDMVKDAPKEPEKKAEAKKA